MSPEQAQARGGVVDQRTDIYALGMTLYELLTLQPAFNGRDHQELLRQIALDEPMPPRRKNPAIPLDLETIVLKAIAKDPSSRYTTAQELADDLRRFMDDQPILARRPRALERTLNWAHRHRDLVVTAAAILVIALILGTATTWVQIRKTEAQVRRTEEVLRRKNSFIIENNALLDRFGMGMIDDANRQFHGQAPTATPEEASQMLEQALSVFQQTIELPPDDLKSRAVIARGYTRLGYTRWMLSMAKASNQGLDSRLLADAQADFRRSIALLEKLLVDSPDNPKIRRYLAEALGLGGLGCSLVSAFRPEEAEPLYRRTIEIRRELLRGVGTGGAPDGRAPADGAAEQTDLSYLVNTVHILARLLDSRGHAAEADALRRQLDDDVAALAARLSKPKFRTRRQALAAQLIHNPPGFDQSTRRDTMNNCRLALMLDPEDAHANNNLAWSLTSVPGDPWFDPVHGLALARKAVALAPNDWALLNTLGVAAFRAGDRKAATEALQESISLTGGGAHDLFFLAMTRWHQGNEQQARMFYDRAVAWTDKYKPADPELGRFRAEAAALLGLSGTKPRPEKQHCETKDIETDCARKTMPADQAFDDAPG